MILDRPRHADIIAAVRKAGASVSLITDGDVAGVIHTAEPDKTGIDIYLGIGGAPEGVLAAAALRCIGGQMQCRLVLDTEEKRERAAKMGIKDPRKKYQIEDMVRGDCLFAATGVTDGRMLRGVRFGDGHHRDRDGGDALGRPAPCAGSGPSTAGSRSSRRCANSARTVRAIGYARAMGLKSREFAVTDGLFLGVESSATGRAWRNRLDERGSARALAIAQRHDLPELLARILAGRNVEVDAVDAFLDPTIKRSMPDPNVLTAMPEAAARIADAIVRGESVAIFGDYDVDGATSAALLARFLRHAGLDPLIHIPDRLFEGYGPNVEAVRALAARGATLLVTVDCGTTSIEPLREAHALGIDVVVIDHHQADEVLPPAVAIVNPNRRDDLSGLGHLAAVGLVFMTVVAVNRVLRARGFWTDGAARARSARASSTMSRSAPSPTWCR